jgi:[ribosomal protein S5]-alanine N-acetyltransferase
MLQTAHLVLRPFVLDDVPALYEIQGNPAAMRFTYVAPSIEACRARLVAYEAMRQLNQFAPWTVLTRDAGRVIGWGGLGVDPSDPDWGPEVSYARHPSYWGRGFAKELVQQSLVHAFHDLGLSDVSAFAMPENAASVRVLEKCGLTRGFIGGKVVTPC